jgi:hypothetical protein
MERRVVTSLSDATDILRCPHAIANRKRYDYDQLALVDLRVASRVETFFQQWPMFNDGELHKSIRSLLLNSIREHTFASRDEVRSFVSASFAADAMTQLDVDRLVMFWHSAYFGLDLEANYRLRASSENLVDLFIFHDHTKLPQADKSLDHVEQFIAPENCKPGGLLEILVRNGASNGAIMNLLIDSYVPVVAAAGLLLLSLAAERPENGWGRQARENYILRILGEAPPFRYITRALEEDGERKFIIMDILQCNAGTAKDGVNDSRPIGLTFGAGHHMCLGYRATIDFLDDLLSAAIATRFAERFEISGTIDPSRHVSSITAFVARRLG